MGASTAPVRQTAQLVPAPSGAGAASSAWDGEPTTTEELQQRYEILMECPGRNTNVQLKLVPAVEKGQVEPKMVCTKQQHKLFIVTASAWSAKSSQSLPAIFWHDLLEDPALTNSSAQN